MTATLPPRPGAYAGELTDTAPVGTTIGTVAAGRTPVRIPADRYISNEWAALEHARLWPRVWQVACSTDHVREPGDFFEYTVGSLSVIVVRGTDGELRAFQNVCLHRGNVICTGSGHGISELRCSYHRWAWSLEGELREVPSRRGFGALRNDDYPLPRVQVGEWAGMVFVNLDPDAEPLDEFLGEVIPDADWLRPHEMACQYLVSVAVPCNWKVGIEAFEETYHVQGIHREMIPSTDDVNSPTRLLGRHGFLGQPYGIASPRLRDGATDQEIWESFVITQGERVGRSGKEPAGPVPPRHPGESMRDLLIRLHEEHAVAQGRDVRFIPHERRLDLAQYSVFPNVSFVFLTEGLTVLRMRPGATPDDCILDLFQCWRVSPGGARPRPLDVTLPLDQADLGLVFNQDLANLRRAQVGLHQPGLTHLSLSYEERRITNMHRGYEEYLGIATQITGGDAEGY